MKLGGFKLIPASAYIAAFPCQQKANTTQFNYGGTAGFATLVGGDPFWYYKGCPVKFRTPSGSPGLVIDTIYYMSRQGVGSYTLHSSYAGALGNNDIAPLSSNGGGTNYIFPAFVVDIAKSNNGVFNTKLTDQNAFGTPNYIGSSAESGSQAQNFVLPTPAISAKYVPGVGSLFISTKVKGASPSVNKRAIFGNGGIGSTQPGFAVYSDAVDPTKLRIGVSNSTATITSPISGSVVFDSNVHTVALAIDGPSQTAKLYIDGIEDVSLSLTIAPSLENQLCFGGLGSNALFAGLRSIHVLGFNGGLPAGIAGVARHLAVNSVGVLLDEHLT